MNKSVPCTIPGCACQAVRSTWDNVTVVPANRLVNPGDRAKEILRTVGEPIGSPEDIAAAAALREWHRKNYEGIRYVRHADDELEDTLDTSVPCDECGALEGESCNAKVEH